jgi:hypothetical protein
MVFQTSGYCVKVIDIDSPKIWAVSGDASRLKVAMPMHGCPSVRHRVEDASQGSTVINRTCDSAIRRQASSRDHTASLLEKVAEVLEEVRRSVDFFHFEVGRRRKNWLRQTVGFGSK